MAGQATYSVIGGPPVKVDKIDVAVQMPELRELIEKLPPKVEVIVQAADVLIPSPIVNVQPPSVHVTQPAPSTSVVVNPQVNVTILNKKALVWFAVLHFLLMIGLICSNFFSASLLSP